METQLNTEVQEIKRVSWIGILIKSYWMAGIQFVDGMVAFAGMKC